jgi:ABC-2 type transport system permease protein
MSTEPTAMQRFYWSLRRELWENRSLTIAPIALAVAFLMGFTVSVWHLPTTLRQAAVLDPMRQHDMLASPYDIGSGLMMGAALIVSVFYCLDALYGERRDRSILFWKSLPVSDRLTVVTKAAVAIVFVPLLSIVLSIVMSLGMLLLSSVVAAASGQSVALLWTRLSLGEMSLLLVYHWLTVHMIGYAPIYAYLLFVSAAVKRAPFIWAFLPPLALAFLERIVFNSNGGFDFLVGRLGGNGMEALPLPGKFPTSPMIHLTPLRYLAAPSLWIEVILTALLLAGAVRLRRSRSVI